MEGSSSFLSTVSPSPSGSRLSSKSFSKLHPDFPSSELKRDWSQSSLATQGTSPSCPSKLSNAAQEAVVIEDLLYILMGIEGNYISFKSEPFPLSNLEGENSLELSHLVSVDIYSINPAFDASLIDLIKRVLPIATCYNVIDAFCFTYSGFKYGFVNHALCSAMKTLLKEYMLLILQLEQEFRKNTSFSLQSFWCHLLKSFPIMKQCAEQCIKIHIMTKHYISTVSSRAPSMMDMASLQHPEERTKLPSDSQFSINSLKFPGLETLSNGGSPWHYKGGGLLGILSQQYIASSGDPESKKLYTYLIRSATEPYLQLLRNWIHLGKLNDPYEEFMIIEKNISKTGLAEDFNDKYWEKRYRLRPSAIPPFLAPFVEKILLTGKYLNVYLECGQSVSQKDDTNNTTTQKDTAEAKTLVFSELCTLADGTGNYIAEIQSAYRLSNRLLLNYLMNQQQLLERLKSIKHFFLLDQSDFIDHFLDSAMDELRAPWHQVKLPKLQSLLDVAIQNPSSVSCKDPFKDDLKVGMDETSLFEQLLGILKVNSEASSEIDPNPTHPGTSSSGLTLKVYNGVQALVLWYHVSFPLSLVFSKRAVVKYQMIFRALMLNKFYLRQLNDTWIHQVHIPSSQHPPEHLRLILRLNSRFCQLRMKMISLIQALGSYLSYDVIEPNHQILEERVRNSQTVDDVLNYLHDFLATCMKETFMSNAKLLR
ncbi:hypothetical protein HMI55_004847, partial [Coelomomyces lativittatus]